MTVNDYWVAKMAATEAGGEETPEEEGVETRSEEESDEEPEEPEPSEPVMVDANYRPVADPDNYAGEVFEYNPKQDPEVFVGGPDWVAEPPEPDYSPEIPVGPVPAETVNPDDVEEGELVDGTELAPGLIDEEEQEKRKAAEAEAAENAVKNQQALLEANAIAVTPEEDPNEDTPAETVLPEEVEPQDEDGEEGEWVDAPEDDEEATGPTGNPEAAAIQRQRTLELTSPAQAAAEAGDDDTYEADKARATAEVPTQANTKQEIRDYLTYEHGIDPDDLQSQNKAELLEWVESLKK